MNESLLTRIINIILRRTDSIDAIVATFDKKRAELVQASERLRVAAAKEEVEAQRLVALATVKQADAERAVTIADRLSALTAP